MELYHWQALAAVYGLMTLATLIKTGPNNDSLINFVGSLVAAIGIGTVAVGVAEVIRRMWLWLL